MKASGIEFGEQRAEPMTGETMGPRRPIIISILPGDDVYQSFSEQTVGCQSVALMRKARMDKSANFVNDHSVYKRRKCIQRRLTCPCVWPCANREDRTRDASNEANQLADKRKLSPRTCYNPFAMYAPFFQSRHAQHLRKWGANPMYRNSVFFAINTRYFTHCSSVRHRVTGRVSLLTFAIMPTAV